MIGEIIKEQRISMNMTRKTLSEGICTEKYVYLIERDERSPSAYILDLMSDRMGIDLFEYYQYLNFKNKSSVVEYKKKFDRYIQSGDIGKLKEASLRAAELEDFKSEPLSYDIKIINFVYEALIEGKTSETIKELMDIFENKKLNIDQLTLINGYVLLSTCYQIEGQLDKAREVVVLAYNMIKNKMDFSRYNTVIINVMISLTSFFYNAKEYDELIKYSKELLEFQERHNEYNRIYYADFYLSFAYYKMKELSKAKEHFMRGIFSASSFRNKMDVNFILKMEDFSEVVENLDIEQCFVDQFYELAE